MDKHLLFYEYRLIERSKNEINGAWKGAHLLLFFLAFVFGSFCTFCFHMLMYLFDEKCVLFPKLLSLTSLRHNVIYEFIPSNKELTDMPVDFLSTQWVEKSTCSLPTYVPLVSGIFGLVWTTMFLMCSTGSRTLSGLQRPWRVLPPVFVFSLAMGGLCIYTSAVTHYGLQELCLKLGEITGSSTCTYKVNVVTLTYERRIRGVYQATRLTILSAWLHTGCWLLSALLALVRMLMAVDFQLVRINVELHGDIDKIMENNEVQIRTVLPEVWVNDELECTSDSKLPSQRQSSMVNPEEDNDIANLKDVKSDLIYLSEQRDDISEQSLVPEERNRIARVQAYKAVSKEHVFIVKWLYDLVDTIQFPELRAELESISSISAQSSSLLIIRQLGQANIESIDLTKSQDVSDASDESEMNKSVPKIDSLVYNKTKQLKEYHELKRGSQSSPLPSTSKQPAMLEESVLNLTPDMKRVLDKVASSKVTSISGSSKEGRKSNLKTIGIQTDKRKRNKRVSIVASRSFSGDEADEQDANYKKDVDKETQTRDKEKQD